MNGAVSRVLKDLAAVLQIPGVSCPGLTACYTKPRQSSRIRPGKQTASTRPRSELRERTSEVGKLYSQHLARLSSCYPVQTLHSSVFSAENTIQEGKCH